MLSQDWKMLKKNVKTFIKKSYIYYNQLNKNIEKQEKSSHGCTVMLKSDVTFLKFHFDSKI